MECAREAAANADEVEQGGDVFWSSSGSSLETDCEIPSPLDGGGLGGDFAGTSRVD